MRHPSLQKVLAHGLKLEAQVRGRAGRGLALQLTVHLRSSTCALLAMVGFTAGRFREHEQEQAACTPDSCSIVRQATVVLSPIQWLLKLPPSNSA
jgi:hypothetical protein